MASYSGSNGVSTWYDDHGDGDPLVLLNPAATDSRAFGPNLGALAAHFHTYTPDRRGHGHTPDVDGPITFDLMAADTVEFLEQVVGGPADLVGRSDGAVVALVTALRRPDLVRRLVCVAGVFHLDGWVPEAIDPDVRCRTLVMVGDDDEVTLEHAIEFYRGLPNGELAVVPGTSHGLLVEKPDLCNRIVVEFLTIEPVETFAPIRRATA